MLKLNHLQIKFLQCNDSFTTLVILIVKQATLMLHPVLAADGYASYYVLSLVLPASIPCELDAEDTQRSSNSYSKQLGSMKPKI